MKAVISSTQNLPARLSFCNEIYIHNYSNNYGNNNDSGNGHISETYLTTFDFIK